MKKVLSIFVVTEISVFLLSSSCRAEEQQMMTNTEFVQSSIEGKTKKTKSILASRKSTKNKKMILYAICAILGGIDLKLMYESMQLIYNGMQLSRAKAKKDAELVAMLLHNRCITVVPGVENQKGTESFMLKSELLLKLSPKRIGNECFSKIEDFYNRLND